MKKAIKIILIASSVIIVIWALLFFIDRPLPDETLLKIPVEEIPEEENGFPQLADLALSMNTLRMEEEIDFPDSGPTDWPAEDVKELEKKFELQLRDLDEVAQKKYIRFRPLEDIVTNVTMTENKGDWGAIHIRNIAWVSFAVAWQEFESGNIDEAIEHVFRLIGIGYKMTDTENSLINNMVGTGIKTKGIIVLDKMISGVELSPAQLREYADRLILLEDDYEGVKWAMSAEYYSFKDMIMNYEQLIEDKENNKLIVGLTLRKNRTSALHARHMSSYIMQYADYCEETLIEKKQFTFATWAYEAVTGNFMGYVVVNISAPNFINAAGKVMFADVFNDLLIIKYYVLAWEAENQKKLDSIEPVFEQLPEEVTTDPFDHMPYRFDPEKRILYSSGANCTDDGGESKINLNTHQRQIDFIEEPDIVMMIDPE